MSAKPVRFTKKQFEDALPRHNQSGRPLWHWLNCQDGEHVYEIRVSGTNKRIMIRSSVGRDGVSFDVGKNSIRQWVEYFWADQWRPLGKESYTTRTEGWEGRLTTKLRTLYKRALEDSKRKAV